MKVSVLILLFITCMMSVSIADTDIDRRDEDLLKQLQDRYKNNQILDEQRYLDFWQRKSSGSQLFLQAQQQLEDLTKKVTELEEQFQQNEKQLLSLKNFYQKRAGDVEELFSMIKHNATDVKKNISESFLSLLLHEHIEKLSSLIDNQKVFQVAHLEIFRDSVIEWLSAQSQNLRFDADLTLADGESLRREVFNVGPFTLIAGESLLTYNARSGKLMTVTQKPATHLSYSLLPVRDSNQGDGYVSVPIDPSRGALLAVLSGAPTFWERILQGGFIVYLILVLGIIGLLLVVERLLFLTKNLRLVEYQKTDDYYNANNPLGRVLSDCQAYRNASIDKLELMLDTAVLREIPRLNRGFGTLKVLIAIAPMLGLLGTVLGMIETFQAITLFGTGDPTIMSSGISQALITTMLGLVVAIPLLLLYTLANSYSKEIQQILEEQSAGVIVSHLIVEDAGRQDAVV